MDTLSAELDTFAAFYNARVKRTTGREAAANTLRTKRSRLRVCCTLTQTKSLEALGNLISDRALVVRLLDVLTLRQSSGAMRTTVSTLKDFGTYAQAQGWCFAPQILPEDMPPTNPAKPITIYSDADVELLVSAARGRGLRWFMFVATVAETGRRVSEVLGLTWDQLNLSAEVPHFNLPTTKNGKQNLVPLTARLRAEVFTPENMAALKAEQRVGTQRQFTHSVETHPFPWSLTCVTRMLQRYCGDIGVEYRGFHCLRHTKATGMLARGVPLQAVSALLGHASVQTTDRIYNHATALSYAAYLDA